MCAGAVFISSGNFWVSLVRAISFSMTYDLHRYGTNRVSLWEKILRSWKHPREQRAFVGRVLVTWKHFARLTDTRKKWLCCPNKQVCSFSFTKSELLRWQYQILQQYKLWPNYSSCHRSKGHCLNNNSDLLRLHYKHVLLRQQSHFLRVGYSLRARSFIYFFCDLFS